MKRILFVDDEPRILEGLRRLLRNERNHWDMRFALGAEQALAMMEETEIDVVVTDMQMPGMDGAELLQRVYERYPGVIRIVLSGQFDTKMGIRAAPVAHQFLIKPCDPRILKCAIERSTGTPAFSDEAVKKVVNSIGSLPSAPKTCTRLIELLNDPEVSLDTISRLITEDVALSAKVLQLVNSAFFSLPSETSSIKAAVSLLGLNLIRDLVTSAAILREFERVSPVQHFSFDIFDRHSRETAEIASKLPAQPEITNFRMMASMLHDVGKLVLCTQLPKRFEEACILCATENISSTAAETQVFGVGHAEIGACLLNLWGLPKVTVDAIAAHHRPPTPSVGDERLALDEIVYLANEAAHRRPKDDLDHIISLPVSEQVTFWRSRIPSE